MAHQSLRHSAGLRRRQPERHGGNQTAGSGLRPGRWEERDGLRRRRGDVIKDKDDDVVKRDFIFYGNSHADMFDQSVGTRPDWLADELQLDRINPM